MDSGGEPDDSDKSDASSDDTSVVVPDAYVFTDSHVQRLEDKYAWYSYDKSTGASSCNSWSSNNKQNTFGQPRRISSRLIASRLQRHAKETSHINGFVEYTDMLTERGVGVPVPAGHSGQPALAYEASTSVVEQLQAATRQRNLARDPITLAALYIASKSRPAADMSEECTVIEKSAIALGAPTAMEPTHQML